MMIAVTEIEQAIRAQLEERQKYLDQANACAGAIKLLQGMLKEAELAEKAPTLEPTTDKKKRK